MLYTDFTSNESPIVCGDCGHGIPLYKVQHIMGEEGHFSILSWQKYIKALIIFGYTACQTDFQKGN